MKKLFLILLLMFPVLLYGQGKKLVCGNAIKTPANSISSRKEIKPDTVVNGDTIWRYPYLYKYETYLILSEDIPDGSYNAYYFNGTSLAFTVTYVNRKAEGIINSYYQDGSLRGTRINHKGKPVGPFTSYHKNGKPSKSGTYKNGKLDSLYYEYWESGSIQSVSNYAADKRTGAYAEYYESGQKKAEGTYVKNKKEGEWKIYSETGDVRTEYYKAGEMIINYEL